MTVDQGSDRWFGIELNNRAWRILQAGAIEPSSPVEEREALVYAAFASAHHWRQAETGTAANSARAEHLISRACTAAGFRHEALYHARRCLELVESEPELMEDWDRAFALEALARAEAAVELATAEATYDAAVTACAQIADPEDRAIVDAELRRAPWFGLAGK